MALKDNEPIIINGTNSRYSRHNRRDNELPRFENFALRDRDTRGSISQS